MARKKLNLPKWSGELARPIDIAGIWGLLNPKPPEERWADVREAQVAKLPALARALGLQPGPREGALEAWYATIVLELAALVCPGFQVKLPSPKLFNPTNIKWFFNFIEKWKGDGRVKSDLEGCTQILKFAEPELAQPHNKTKLRQQARTLANLISLERASRKRLG
jgi:hypothetical protein